MSKNTTLSEQFRNHVEIYHTVTTVQKLCRKYNTVKTVPKSCRKIPHCQNSSEIITENTTLSEQFRNHVKIPHCQNSSKIISENTTLSEQCRNHAEKYQTVRTVPKSCTQRCRVPKSCRKIPHCQNSSEMM